MPQGKIVDDPGELGPIASRILMKVLYAARLARFDLLRAVCHLARYITKWTKECDKRLFRLMCYIHSTLGFRQAGWVGGVTDQLEALHDLV